LVERKRDFLRGPEGSRGKGVKYTGNKGGNEEKSRMLGNLARKDKENLSEDDGGTFCKDARKRPKAMHQRKKKI